jgi:hypothetical protein
MKGGYEPETARECHDKESGPVRSDVQYPSFELNMANRYASTTGEARLEASMMHDTLQ